VLDVAILGNIYEQFLGKTIGEVTCSGNREAPGCRDLIHWS
jgi:hypothetical protein